MIKNLKLFFIETLLYFIFTYVIKIVENSTVIKNKFKTLKRRKKHENYKNRSIRKNSK